MKKLILLALLNFSLSAHSDMIELKSVGPNNLNAALLVAGLVNNYRYSSSAEMWTTLNSSICRRLEKNEDLQVRDLGIIFGNKTLQNTSEISHAFVLINSHIAYEKINSNINSGYQVKPISAILQRFDLDANLNYYRCQTLEQFVGNKTSFVKSYARAALKNVETIEAGLQSYLGSYSLPENKNKYLEIERQLQIVARKMSDISESEFEGDILISKIIASRYVSIAAQIKALGHPEFYNLVQPWELQDKNIFQVFNLIVQMRIQDDLDLFYLNLRQFFVSVFGPIVQSIRHVPLNLSLTEEYADNAGGASLYKDSASIQLGYDLHHFSQMTPDAYLAILCHETGHLLGGPPYFQNGPSQQISSSYKQARKNNHFDPRLKLESLKPIADLDHSENREVLLTGDQSHGYFMP